MPRSLHLCVNCDYDLRGADRFGGTRCPECGQILTTLAIAIAREQSFFRRLRRRIVVVLAVAGALAAVALVAFRDHALFLAPLLVLVLAPLVPTALAIYGIRGLPDE